MITSKEYQKALEDGRILVVGTKYTSNGWTHFRVYEIAKTAQAGLTRFKFIAVENSSYWDKKTHDYKCIAWGTDRRFEIILSIGYALGLRHQDIPQNYEWLQG